MRLFKVLKSLVGNKPGVDPIPAVSYDAPATIIDAAEQDGDLSFVATTFSILNGDGADIGGGNQPCADSASFVSSVASDFSSVYEYYCTAPTPPPSLASVPTQRRRRPWRPPVATWATKEMSASEFLYDIENRTQYAINTGGHINFDFPSSFEYPREISQATREIHSSDYLDARLRSMFLDRLSEYIDIQRKHWMAVPQVKDEVAICFKIIIDSYFQRAHAWVDDKVMEANSYIKKHRRRLEKWGRNGKLARQDAQADEFFATLPLARMLVNTIGSPIRREIDGKRATLVISYEGISYIRDDGLKGWHVGTTFVTDKQQARKNKSTELAKSCDDKAKSAVLSSHNKVSSRPKPRIVKFASNRHNQDEIQAYHFEKNGRWAS